MLTWIKNGLRNIWKDLNRSIYVGDRLKANLQAISFASYVTAILGVILIVVNILKEDKTMLLAAIATTVAGAGCAFCANVLKDRRLAIKIPTLFCAIIITIYVFTGAGQGSAVLWSILIPIGMCYFVSVKYGIIISAYYTILFFFVFLTPLNSYLQSYYNVGFMERYPLMYASLTLFTGMAMIQYHRKTLFEMDYANRLAEEVKKQTSVAEERSERLQKLSIQTIQTLAHAIDAKDPYTIGHSSRVSQYSVKIAEAIGWDTGKIDNIKYSALLHDIGKIGVPDSILNNPRRLTDVEYEIIKSHTTMGGDILKGRTMIKSAEDVARSHHEKYDGTGYPNGLKGEDISEEARIVAIADAFDAMSSNRVYRRSCDKDHIRNELEKGKGRQFDPEFADVFIKLWDKGELDGIMESDPINDEDVARESSVLLQKAIDSFIERRKTWQTSEEGAENEDIGLFLDRVKGDGSHRGAMSVEYTDFMKLYEYAQSLEQRFSYPFDLMVITLDPPDGTDATEEGMERSMYFMEQAIKQTIRDVDIVTRYGTKRFLVILLGADSNGAKVAADRVFRGYYKMSGSGTYLPSYKSVTT